MRVFTSIPPRYANSDRFEYLKACIGSWTRCGFQAVSLNRYEEADAVRRMNLLEVIPVHTGEAWYPDRFGPCFGNIFDLIDEDEPAAVVNADIYMLGSADLGSRLIELAKTGFTVARRTDVEHLGASAGTVSLGGIDLVAFTKRSVPKTTTDRKIRKFQLGLPWWDYVIPTLASFEGPVFRIEEPFIVHQVHADRWDMDVWHHISEEVRLMLNEMAPREFFSKHALGEMQTATACVDWLFRQDTMIPQTLPIAPDQHFALVPRLRDNPMEKKSLTRKILNYLQNLRQNCVKSHHMK